MIQFFLVNGFFDRFAGMEEKTTEKSVKSEDYTLEEYLRVLKEYKEGEADILINIATIYFEEESTEESLNYLEKAMEIYDELEYIEKKALVMDIMGDIYSNTHQERTALEYYKEAFKLYSEADSDAKDDIIPKINETEISLKSVEGSAKQFKVKKEDLLPGNIITDDYNYISKNISDVISILDGANTYMSYANNENAREELKNAYDMSSGIGDANAQATILMIMGNVSLKNSQPTEALTNFKKAQEIFKQNNNMVGEAVAMLLIGTTYYITGNTDNVAINFRKAMELLKKSEDILGEELAIKLMNTIYEE